MGDELKLTNFELCQQYFKTIVKNTKTRTKSSADIREILKVGISKDNIYTKSYIFIHNLFSRSRHLMLLAIEGGREFRD